MINWNKVLVKINNTGIMAQSAGYSNQSSLTPIYALGQKGSSDQSVSGPQTHEVSISYIPQASKDPIWGTLNDYKTQNFNPPALVLDLAGISGSFYLTNYAITFRPNELLSASATFRSYNQISGTLTESSFNSDDEQIEFTGFFNGYTSNIVYTPQNFNPIDNPNEPITGPAPRLEIPNVFNLNYEADIELLPIYGLTNKTPIDIQINGGTESLSFLMEDFRDQGFSGALIKELLSFPTSDIISYNMGFDFTSTQSSITIDFTNGMIDSSSFETSVGSYTYTTYNVKKYF